MTYTMYGLMPVSDSIVHRSFGVGLLLVGFLFVAWAVESLQVPVSDSILTPCFATVRFVADASL